MRILQVVRAPGIRQTARKAARAGDWRGAAQAYGALVRLRIGTARDMVQRAHALKEAGDVAGAADAYHEAAGAFPYDAEAQLQHGLYLEIVGRVEQAGHVLARALVLDPDNGFLHAKLAQLGIAEEGHDTAILTGILAGHDAAPRRAGPVSRLILGWRLRQARRHARAGRWQAAARDYRRMLVRHPHDPRLLVQLGHALREQGEATQAIAAYRRALIGSPRQPDTYLHIGHALKMLGRREAALQAYLAATRLQPGLAAARAELNGLGWSDIVDAGGDRPVAGSRRVMPGGLTRREQTIWRQLATRIETGN